MDSEQLIRFLSHVEKIEDGCWVWIGSIKTGKKGGYGNVVIKGKTFVAHRVSYEHFVGEIPKGLVIDHLCRNRACVNPAHLEPVTIQENIRRGETGLHNRVKTICRNGHKYTAKNTYVYPSGHRECRTCRTATKKRYRDGRREKGLKYA